MRLTRQNLPALKRKAGTTFVPGRWQTLWDRGAEGPIVLLASGGLVGPTIDALEILAKEWGPEKLVLVNANWIRPLDEFLLMELMNRKAKAFVTLEDHYTVGGLGGAVAEFVASRASGARVMRIGLEEFGQSGSPEDVYRFYGFTGNGLADRIRSWLG